MARVQGISFTLSSDASTFCILFQLGLKHHPCHDWVWPLRGHISCYARSSSSSGWPGLASARQFLVIGAY